MTNEINEDPQSPTQDSPPPKQYAHPSGGTPGERGTDQRTPKVPGRMEDEDDKDDKDQSAAGGKGPNNPSQGGNKDPSKSGEQQTPAGSKQGNTQGSSGGRS